MKKIYLCIVSIYVLFLVGCAKPIMSPVEYNKPIDLQIDSNAVLYWEIGKQSTSALAFVNNNSIAGSIIESIDRQNNPSRYNLSYGKAEQAIFMTSFKNTLQRQRVFKNVELITDYKKLNPKEVLVTIYFKTTRVTSPERGYQISLNVDMSITGAGKPNFTRTYFVKNDEICGSFQEQQNKISVKLTENLIAGLKHWYKNK